MRLSPLASAGVTLVIGLLLGGGAGIYVDQSYPEAIPPLGAWGQSRQHQAQVDEALRILEAHYYNPHLDYSKLQNSTLAGMVAGLGDQFSAYYSPSQFRAEQSGFAGTYSGIGVYLDFSGDTPLITGLVPDSPATGAGLMPGDTIQAVDGKPVKGVGIDQVGAMIQGQAGTNVTLTIGRGGQMRDFTMTRARLTTPMVASTTLPGPVLYVRIYRFGDDTQAEFDRQLSSGLHGAAAIVLDLRGNPGGYVDAAQAVGSRFVPSGELFEMHNRDGSVARLDSQGDHPADHVPVVVLVDGDTASAAEIVAGALRVDRRAPLVGVKTFGKGSVQQDFQLSGGGDLHLTVAHWFLPDGSSVDHKGLTPDVDAERPASAPMFDVRNSSSDYRKDPQLMAGLGALPQVPQ